MKKLGVCLYSIMFSLVIILVYKNTLIIEDKTNFLHGQVSEPLDVETNQIKVSSISDNTVAQTTQNSPTASEVKGALTCDLGHPDNTGLNWVNKDTEVFKVSDGSHFTQDIINGWASNSGFELDFIPDYNVRYNIVGLYFEAHDYDNPEGDPDPSEGNAKYRMRITFENPANWVDIANLDDNTILQPRWGCPNESENRGIGPVFNNNEIDVCSEEDYTDLWKTVDGRFEQHYMMIKTCAYGKISKVTLEHVRDTLKRDTTIKNVSWIVAKTTCACGNGACGSDNGQNLYSTPINLCSTGTASAVSGSGPWTWSCIGNGGTDASCSANKKTDGTCGSSNGGSFTTAPTTNLCSAGSASGVSGTGPWSWSCTGINGGTTASCSANLTAVVNGVCGTAAANFPNGTTAYPSPLQYCAAGSANTNPAFPAAGATVSWNCTGSGGGTTASCSASQAAATPINGTCGTAATTYAASDTSYAGAYCATGTQDSSPVFPAQGASVSWNCNGSNGGTNSACSANRANGIENGVCNPSTAREYSSTEYVFSGSPCSSGTPDPNPVNFPAPGGSVTWMCRGVNGGSDAPAACIATRRSYCIDNPDSPYCNQCTNPSLSLPNNNLIACNNPSPPQIKLTDNNSIGNTASGIDATKNLKLQWSDIMPAPNCSVKFDFELKDAGGTQIYSQTDLTNSQIEVPSDKLEFGTEYKWKVKATNTLYRDDKLVVRSVGVSPFNPQGIKSINHTYDNIAQIDPANWIKFDFDDSSWANAKTVWDNNWSKCNEWRWLTDDPTGDIPQDCKDNALRFLDPDNILNTKVINFNGNVTRAPLDRDFFRKKFTLPDNAIITSANLYTISDNIASYWVNEMPLKPSQGSLNNNNDCTTNHENLGYGDRLTKIDITDFVKTGNNILAANLVNTAPCTNDHLMGLQFYIKINYRVPERITVLDSPEYTFTTNYYPEYIQSGAAFADTDENPQINIDVAIGDNPITSTQALCNGNELCNLGPVNGGNKFGGINTCFSGDADMIKTNFGQTDNPITFWMDYEDKDTFSTNPIPLCQDTFKSHKLALVPESEYSDDDPVIDDNGIFSKAVLYIEYVLKPNGQFGSEKGLTGANKIVNVEPLINYDAHGKLRIAYKLEFLNNFPTGSYDIYALVTSNINDPRGLSTNSVLYDIPNSDKAVNTGKFRKIGEWTIDTTPPEIQKPSFGDYGFDTFNIDWSVKSNLKLQDLNLGCYSINPDELTKDNASTLGYYNPTDFISKFEYPFPGSFDGNTFNTNNPPLCSTEGQAILAGRVNDNPDTIQILTTRHRLEEPSDSQYFKARGSAIDLACNIRLSDEGQANITAPNSWISTIEGGVISKTVDLSPQPTLSSTDHNLYCDYKGLSHIEESKLLYSTVNNDILNLSSSTVLSTDNTITPSEKSLIGAVVNSYTDSLEKNLSLLNKKYFDVINDKLMNKGLISKTYEMTQTIAKMSDLDTSVCPGPINGVAQPCYIKINGDLVINGNNGLSAANSCDKKMMVLVGGNLVINDNLMKDDPAMCCAFIVKDNIDFNAIPAPKDEQRFVAANNTDKLAWINTSLYDCATGFYYSDGGNVTINADRTNYPINQNTENYADAFGLFGQILTNTSQGNVTQYRSNGLRNRLQPPVYIQQDSCIYKNFRAASEVFLSARDITY